MSDYRYHPYYADSHDIDCFFKIGNNAYHFASNGYQLPVFITRKKNLSIQQTVNDYLNSSTDRQEVTIQEENIRRLIARDFDLKEGEFSEAIDSRRSIAVMIDDYASTFKEMATIGFISMDLGKEGEFYVIAKPQGQTLPDNILCMLPVGEDSIMERIKDD